MRWVMTCLLVIVTVPGLRAADKPELTPLVDPQIILPAPAIWEPVPTGFYRPSRWDVWQYYAVDRTGHWRPRVALGAPEPFYLYNGVPYPLLPVQPRVFMPHILD